MPEIGNCGNCVHWSPSLTGEKYGECLVINAKDESVFTYPNEPQPLAFVTMMTDNDGMDIEPSLLTRADFGCVMGRFTKSKR